MSRSCLVENDYSWCQLVSRKSNCVSMGFFHTIVFPSRNTLISLHMQVSNHCRLYPNIFSYCFFYYSYFCLITALQQNCIVGLPCMISVQSVSSRFLQFSQHTIFMTSASIMSLLCFCSNKFIIYYLFICQCSRVFRVLYLVIASSERSGLIRTRTRFYDQNLDR